MADNLISYAIKAQDDLTPALEDVAGAAKETQDELDKAAAANDLLSAAEKELVEAVKKAREALEAKAKQAGLTAGEMANVEKAVEKAAKAEADAAQAMKDAGNAAKDTGADLGDLSNTAGDVESRMRGLAGAVGLVSPELAGLMNVLAEVSGGLEALGKSAGMVGSRLGMVGTAAGALAVVVAGAATAWTVYTNLSERAGEAAARQETALDNLGLAAARLTDQVKEVQAAWVQFTGMSTDVSDQMAIINGLMTEAEVAAKKQAAAIEAAARPAIKAAGERVAILQQELSIRQDLEALANSGDRAAIKAMGGQTRDTSQIEAELAAARAVLDSRKAEVRQTVENVQALAEYRDAIKAASAAEKANKGVKSAPAVEAVEAVQGASMAFATEVDQLGALLSRLAGSGLDLEAAERAVGFSLEDLQAVLAGVTVDTLPEVQEALSAFADAAGAAGMVVGPSAATGPTVDNTGGKGLQIASDLLGVVSGGFGGVLSMLGSLGPVGAIIAGALGLLSDGASGLFGILDGIGDAATTILGALPEVVAGLADHLQPILVGIVEMLPDVLGGIIGAIPELLVGVLRVGIGELLPALILLVPRLGVELTAAFAEVMLELPAMLLDLAKTLAQDLPRVFADAFRDMLQDMLAVGDRVRDGAQSAASRLPDLTDRAGRGGGNVIFQGLGFGDDRQVMARIRDLLQGGRLGVVFG